MKITIESTSKIVQILPSAGRRAGVFGEQPIEARVWQGLTESGTPVHCFVTRIALAKENPTKKEELELEQALMATRTPVAAVEAIPMRLIL